LPEQQDHPVHWCVLEMCRGAGGREVTRGGGDITNAPRLWLETSLNATPHVIRVGHKGM